MNITTAAPSRFRRLAAFTALATAPVLIALGAAATSHADPITPSTSTTAPVAHPAFPYQDNAPQPGTQTHHDHQNNRG